MEVVNAWFKYLFIEVYFRTNLEWSKLKIAAKTYFTGPGIGFYIFTVHKASFSPIDPPIGWAMALEFYLPDWAK